MNLNQVTVPSGNLDLAIPFYQKLGLKLIVDAKPHYARFVCPNGESTFSIHLTNKFAGEEGIYVYFECDNLDNHVADLITKGIKFDEMPNDKTWLWREARLKDPDNNQIILYYAGENRLNPPWRIKEE
jgi:catechol 2,3-dioxygenase-like lactoylglutathione lyase family enzyme